MSQEIRLEMLPRTMLEREFGSVENFNQAVTAHVEAKRAHRSTIGEPAPTAHLLVERVVKRIRVDGQPDDWAAAHDIIDDRPPPVPPPSLRQRKDVLLHQVAEAEQERISAVIPPGKRRSFALRARAIADKDAERSAQTTLRRQALLAKPAGERTADETAFLAASENVAAFMQAGRPTEDAQFLTEQAGRDKAVANIERHAAMLMHEVEDLTEQTIETWALTEFPS